MSTTAGTAGTRSSSLSVSDFSDFSISNSELDNVLETTGSVQSKKHPRFSFESDMVAFTIDDTEYCVHKYLLATHAPSWLEELGQMSGPVILKNVRVSEVDAFLSILYPSNVLDYAISSVEDWSSVLRLATRWQSHSICQLAQSRLEPLASTLDKLILARELKIAAWLLPSLAALCLRPEPLRLEEAERMLMADVVLVFTARELVKTEQLPANEDAISLHISTALEPQLKSANTSHKSPAQSEQPSAESLDKSLAASTHTSGGGIYNSEDFAKALRDQNYECATDMMSEEDFDDIIHQLGKWTKTMSGSQGKAAVQDLAWAIICRCARNSSFIKSAVRVLSDWKKESDMYSNYIQKLIEVACLDEIINHSSQYFNQMGLNPTSTSGRVLYRRYERWLSDEDFRLRRQNAVKLVAEAASAKLLSSQTICEKIPAHHGQARAFYDFLVLLGPVLSDPAVKPIIDQRLETCDKSIWNGYGGNVEEHRLWMQKIYRLRDRNWVADE